MPSPDTLQLQKDLLALGRRFGFDAVMEAKKELSAADEYSPHFDVAWYFSGKTCPNQNWWKAVQNISRDKVKCPQNWPKYAAAVFEIENRDPTSKHELGNLINMHSFPSCFRFLVTNTAASKDMYRRAVKINRTYRHFFGDRNSIVIDKDQIKTTFGVKCVSTATSVSGKRKSGREKGGGSDKSMALRTLLCKQLKKTGFGIFEDGFPSGYPSVFAPENVYYWFEPLRNSTVDSSTQLLSGVTFSSVPNGQLGRVRKASGFVYECAPDIILGHTISGGFVEWIRAVASSVGVDSVLYPCLSPLFLKHDEWFVPVCGIEIETTANKHLIGGLANLSRQCLYGVIVSDDPSLSRIVQSVSPRIGGCNVFTVASNKSGS